LKIVLLIVIVIASIVVVNPFYNYAVGDDWTYALSVQHLYQTGSLRLPDESAASLIFQVVWGYLFCVPFGFSFAALHLSTLVLSLAGLLGFHKLCDAIVGRAAVTGASADWVPLLATLTVWFNPVYFSLSFTFYTDVPFYALVLLALYFFVSSELKAETGERRATRDFFLGSLCSCCAVLVRQYAIVVPFVVGVLIVTKQWRVRERRRKLILLSLPFLVLVGFYFWLVKYHGVPTQFAFSQLEMLKSYRMAHDLRHLPFIALFYVGLYALPLMPAVLASWLAHSRRRESPIGAPLGLASLVLVGYAMYAYFAEGMLMPYLTASPITPRFSTGIAIVLTLLAVLSAALMVQLVAQRTGGWMQEVAQTMERLIRVVTVVLVLCSIMLASGVLDDLLLRQIDSAITSYYQRYTSAVPASQSLDSWRARVGDFYSGAKEICYELTVLGVALTFVAVGIRRRRGLSQPPTHHSETVSNETKLALTLTIAFVVLFVLISCRFDRYVFIVFPILLIAGLRVLAVGLHLRVAVGWVFVFAVVTIASAKTMIAGQGALWTAGQELLRRGVPIEEIRLNYTFDAYSLYLLGKRDVGKTGNPSYWAYAEAQKPKYIASRPDGGGQLVLEVPFTNYFKLASDRIEVWKVSGEPQDRSVVK
jgi:hypothetical protein